MCCRNKYLNPCTCSRIASPGSSPTYCGCFRALFDYDPAKGSGVAQCRMPSLVPHLHTVVVSGPCLTDFLQVAGLPSRIPFLFPHLHTVVVSGPCLTDFLQVAGLPGRIPSLVPHLHTVVVSGPCLTMTQPKTVGCLARAWGSTTGTSCTWPTPVTMSGGRPRESHLRERRRAWELSQVNEGKLTCCSWNCLQIEMLQYRLRGV